MTEEEAKTKWCPMVRHVAEEEPACNRVGINAINEGQFWNKCIASDCMMWVWDTVPGYITLVGDDGSESEIPAMVRGKTGRCGLVKK